MSIHIHCKFNSQPFAEGRFRLAYEGEYIEPLSKRGKKCVVKRKKKEYTWDSNGWDESLKLQKKAQELAELFNQANKSGMPIKFTEVNHVQVISTSSTSMQTPYRMSRHRSYRMHQAPYPTLQQSHSPRLYEYIIVEDYLPGKYTKWCSNYGHISPGSELMQAFMHWSWVHSKGEIMIADLQGVKNNMKYDLTDPALLSNSVKGGMYGSTDMGVEGMAMFFLNHTCNQYCRDLPKPCSNDVVKMPYALVKLMIEGWIMRATAYSHQLKFPEDVRRKMTVVFPSIAARNGS